MHPVIIEGQGHTAITNVEAFSGDNAALTNFRASWDFMLVRGEKRVTVSLMGARMRNYEAAEPVTVENPQALVRMVACVDKHERLLEKTIGKP